MDAKSFPNNAHQAFGDSAPKLAQITDEVLFGEVWARSQLTARDRSMVTCTALIALGKIEQLHFHLPLAIKNGVSVEELIELVTHLAFYSGWPTAMSAVTKIKELGLTAS